MKAVILFLGLFVTFNFSPLRAEAHALGVGQGNGLTTYSNNDLDISFLYPIGWRLAQSPDAHQVALDNSPLASNGAPVSELHFALANKVFGQAVETDDELRAVLVRSLPSKALAPISFRRGETGYFWQSNRQDGSAVGEYYLLNQSHTILHIAYKVYRDFDGASTIEGILASMTSCYLPEDQGIGSLKGAWNALPIHLVFDKKFYETNNGNDAKAMKRAVATWNVWADLKGMRGFVIDKDGEGMDIPLSSDCSQATYTKALTTAVGVWRIDGSLHHENQRTSCGLDSNGYPKKILSGIPAQTDWANDGYVIAGASVLMNFADFNTPHGPIFDVESAFLHELGHILGMLDSCNDGVNGNETTAPACATTSVGYTDAVMAPFQAGRIHRSLTQNDYGRVSCLY